MIPCGQSVCNILKICGSLFSVSISIRCSLHNKFRDECKLKWSFSIHFYAGWIKYMFRAECKWKYPRIYVDTRSSTRMFYSSNSNNNWSRCHQRKFIKWRIFPIILKEYSIRHAHIGFHILNWMKQQLNSTTRFMFCIKSDTISSMQRISLIHCNRWGVKEKTNKK